MRRLATLVIAGAIGCAAPAIGIAAEVDFRGVWQIRHRASLGSGEKFSEGAVDRKAIQINAGRSGKVTMSKPDFTPEMLALGYEPFDPGFDGSVRGDSAVGTGAYWKVPFWTKDASTCPRPAGLRFRSKWVLEFISAVPLREDCGWTFKDFADYARVQHVVLTLSPVFIVREIRFFDQDASPGRRIYKAAPHQKFFVEVEFEVPPPAPIYVSSAKSRIIVRPTNSPHIFRSQVVTRAGLQSGSSR